MIRRNALRFLPRLSTGRALVSLCGVATICLIWMLCRHASYGFDFTDESYYLVWMTNPWLYDGSTSQFGFVYHPVYQILGGDIAALRLMNFAVTFLLASGLVYTFLVSLTAGLMTRRVSMLTLSASFASSSLVVFQLWLPTPSYNSLNLQALLIASTGLLLAKKEAVRSSLIGWALLGIGGSLAFLAKPTTAVVLAIVALVYLCCTGVASVRLTALSLLSSALIVLVSAVLIDSSVTAFVRRLKLGSELAKTLDAGYDFSSVFRLDLFLPDVSTALAFVTISGTLFVVLWSISKVRGAIRFVGKLNSMMFFVSITVIALGFIKVSPVNGSFKGLLMLAPVLATVTASLIISGATNLRLISSRNRATAMLFSVMPFVYAFGTGNNYWVVGSWAAVFWLLAGLVPLRPMLESYSSSLLFSPVALAAQAVTALLLLSALEHPYRQPQPLRHNKSELSFGPQGTSLVLSRTSYEYIESAIAAANSAGLKRNTSIIDLSGQSPGILFAMGSRNIGHVWMFGGYPGSIAFAEAGLSRVSCEELSLAWILTEPDGPISIPTEVLTRAGIDFASNYEQVASWQTAVGAGGYANPRTQYLYRPAGRKGVAESCEVLRREMDL